MCRIKREELNCAARGFEKMYSQGKEVRTPFLTIPNQFQAYYPGGCSYSKDINNQTIYNSITNECEPINIGCKKYAPLPARADTQREEHQKCMENVKKSLEQSPGITQTNSTLKLLDSRDIPAGCSYKKADGSPNFNSNTRGCPNLVNCTDDYVPVRLGNTYPIEECLKEGKKINPDLTIIKPLNSDSFPKGCIIDKQNKILHYNYHQSGNYSSHTPDLFWRQITQRISGGTKYAYEVGTSNQGISDEKIGVTLPGRAPGKSAALGGTKYAYEVGGE